VSDFIINSWNEWDPLESVVIGRATHAQVPRSDISLKAINYANLLDDKSIPVGVYPQDVIDEANEDLDKLCSFLKSQQVQVFRPEDKQPSLHGTGDWDSESYYQFCPRDHTLVYGDLILECPMPLRSRYFETFGLRNLYQKAFEDGAQWLSAPMPRLTDQSYQSQGVHKDMLTLNENEPCFDAANILRCGEDLFYLVSNSGNKLGAKWLQSALGSKTKVHEIHGMYSFMHLDSTLCLLRPGLVLLNPERVTQENLPKVLQSWDKIWCPPFEDIGYEGKYNHSSPWIGMNLLMINPNLAVVEESQKKLIALLESHKIEVCPLPMRHQRTLGGGFHCVSLDLNRKGSLESYFS
jgi:N-dimethylarginine dimethylaminohydrolase